jgi:hypothetical protein
MEVYDTSPHFPLGYPHNFDEAFDTCPVRRYPLEVMIQAFKNLLGLLTLALLTKVEVPLEISPRE